MINCKHDVLHKRRIKVKPYLDTQGIPTIAIGNTFLDGKKSNYAR
jgi:GH24 family phage-related lysozyme (muramidase)